MKEHTEFTLSAMKKWDLIRYIVKLEKIINKAIKKLDNVSSQDVRSAVKILKKDTLIKIEEESNENNWMVKRV